MELVIDASIIGCACRNNKNCLLVLGKAKSHKICYNKKIFNEYKALINRDICTRSIQLRTIKDWVSLLIDRFAEFGKKTYPEPSMPKCLERLIGRNKFGTGDVIYVQTALKCNDHIIISNDHHFIHYAKRCIESIGVVILDINGALDNI